MKQKIKTLYGVKLGQVFRCVDENDNGQPDQEGEVITATENKIVLRFAKSPTTYMTITPVSDVTVDFANKTISFN